MKMRCIVRCQIDGEIYHVGDEVDMKDELLEKEPVARSAFTPVDPRGRQRPRGAAIVVAGLNRKQVLLKLQGARVPCDDTMSNDDLAKLHNLTFDAKNHDPNRRPDGDNANVGNGTKTAEAGAGSSPGQGNPPESQNGDGTGNAEPAAAVEAGK